MKITDIVSEYGLRDEPAYGTTKASVRQATAMNTNANKRVNNKNADANRELNIANKSPTINPKNNDADNNFRVITVAPKSLGKLVNIKSKSINIPCYI